MTQIIVLTFGLLLASLFEGQTAPVDIENEEDGIEIGDMVLTQQQYEHFYTNKSSFRRLGTLNPEKLWPNATVPYRFVERFKNKSISRKLKASMDKISEVSCVKFVPLIVKTGVKIDRHKNKHLIIRQDKRCTAVVGYIWYSYIKVGPYCQTGNFFHDLLHVLGFLHMHVSPDRDKYVKINHDNVMPKERRTFEKASSNYSMFGTSYDFDSVMHLPTRSYGIDMLKPTIIPLKKVTGLGKDKELSKGDIYRLNKLYKCEEKAEKAPSEAVHASKEART